MFHLHPPLPRNIEKKTDVIMKFLKSYVNYVRSKFSKLKQSRKKTRRAHHVPELVKGDYEAQADSPQSFKGSDVNFHPDPFLNTSVQFSQRTAFTH